MTEQEYLNEAKQIEALTERHNTFAELTDRIKYDQLLLEQLKNTTNIHSINIKWSSNTATQIDIPFNKIKDTFIEYVQEDLEKTKTELSEL